MSPPPFPSIHEVSDIGLALRNDSIEWSNDALESLQLFEAAYVAYAACTFAVCAARFWLFWSTSCCETE